MEAGGIEPPSRDGVYRASTRVSVSLSGPKSSALARCRPPARDTARSFREPSDHSSRPPPIGVGGTSPQFNVPSPPAGEAEGDAHLPNFVRQRERTWDWHVKFFQGFTRPPGTSTRHPAEALHPVDSDRPRLGSRTSAGGTRTFPLRDEVRPASQTILRLHHVVTDPCARSAGEAYRTAPGPRRNVRATADRRVR